ncbi:PH domain-containing protein [Amycolatopsis sp. cg13]|uniref:PH domain-containing protein n=1 Tax=Amycolatopsis sp. cg13 TaxID=3238807 RepID=UPI00352312D6
MAKKQQDQRADEGRKAVFRIPTTAYLAIGLLTVCVTPIALGEIGGFQWLYVFPLALLVFVARTRTVANREGLQVRTVFGQRDLPWSSLKGLAITNKARVRAVLGDDTQVALPTVRTRHLPVLALVSEGKIKDPSGVLSDEELTGQKPAAETAPDAAQDPGPESAPGPSSEPAEPKPPADAEQTSGGNGKPAE